MTLICVLQGGAGGPPPGSEEPEEDLKDEL